jgi:hypothetical protein
VGGRLDPLRQRVNGLGEPLVDVLGDDEAHMRPRHPLTDAAHPEAVVQL